MTPAWFWPLAIISPLAALLLGMLLAHMWDQHRADKHADAVWDDGYAEGWRSCQFRMGVMDTHDDTIIRASGGRGRHAADGDQLGQLERELAAYQPGRHAQLAALPPGLFDAQRAPARRRVFALIRQTFQSA